MCVNRHGARTQNFKQQGDWSRFASLEEVSRLHDELNREAPVLERLIADGIAGRFPAEEVDIQDWKEMLKQVQELRLKLRKRLNQRIFADCVFHLG